MNTEENKVCLKWSEFQENAVSTFGTLREDAEFTDVTLACEDGQQVEAHKVILASSSPFFLNILKRNKHPHPLIYMRGLKAEDLAAMIDFLYLGEAKIYQENLDSFLAVAEELQLKGLMGSGDQKDVEEILKTSLPKNNASKSVHQRQLVQQETQPSVDKVKTEPISLQLFGSSPVPADLQDLDDKIKSMMEISETRNLHKGIARICKVCGKTGQWSAIRDHIEAKHITGVSHTCDICGCVVKTRNALSCHKSVYHRK